MMDSRLGKLGTIAVVTMVFVALIGCSPEEEDAETDGGVEQSQSNIDSKYYGEWQYVSSGEKVNIISSSKLNFIERDANLLEVNQSGSVYYLIRSSIADVHVRGQVDVSEITRGYGNAAGIDVILENVLDENIHVNTKTDENGTIEIDGIPAGEYQLEIKDESKQLIARVDIENAEEDIGTYKLTGDDLNNFKAELIVNDTYIVADGEIQQATLRVHNIGDEIGFGLTYEINLQSDEFVVEFEEKSSDSTGSIVPNSYKDIPINLTFFNLPTNVREYTLDVRIIDTYGNNWIDSYAFNVHRAVFDITVLTKDAAIRGYVQDPLNNTLMPIDMSNSKITVPLMSPDKPYTLILSNPDLDQETAYSIGVNRLATLDEFNASDGANNTESQAKTIPFDGTENSYLFYTDIDFWHIYTPEDAVVSPVQIPEAIDCQGEVTYGEWSQCSSFCGEQSRTATFHVLQEALYGGAQCEETRDTWTETQSCHQDACKAGAVPSDTNTITLNTNIEDKISGHAPSIWYVIDGVKAGNDYYLEFDAASGNPTSSSDQLQITIYDEADVLYDADLDEGSKKRVSLRPTLDGKLYIYIRGEDSALTYDYDFKVYPGFSEGTVQNPQTFEPNDFKKIATPIVFDTVYASGIKKGDYTDWYVIDGVKAGNEYYLEFDTASGNPTSSYEQLQVSVYDDSEAEFSLIYDADYNEASSYNPSFSPQVDGNIYLYIRGENSALAYEYSFSIK